MKAEQWQQLDSLFQAALDRRPEERAAFLDEACAEDGELRKQVEALLTAHERAGNFIESPAMQAAARGLAADQQSSAMKAGQTVSHYRIISPLGSGGMGEVYLAEDLILSRQVAIKVLPEFFTRDRERLRRFHAEARTASALNHPNIITIFEMGEFSERQFIVTEFIDGTTLRDHLLFEEQRSSEKLLKLREKLDIAIQTADALAAAHEAHIVHRDIKPENIMLRGRDGYVKILDFGLAKLTEQQPGTVDAEAPTKTLFQTEEGVVLGTVIYMSPEQAKGLKVDPRTDIWSLGIVLYEMVAGCLPFEGSKSEVLASILNEKEPPPLARFTREAPAELERIVEKALRKDREERYQTAKDMLLDLKRLKQKLEVEAEIERTAPPELRGAGGEAQPFGGQEVIPTAPGEAHTSVAGSRTTSSVEYIAGKIKRHKRVALIVLAAIVAATTVAAYFIYFARSDKTAINSVAVLPFVNVTADPNTEYLSDGITESLINNLSRLPQMKIMSRSSVIRYKGKETDVQTIGRELGVEAVLMGRVIQRGNDLSISIELVDARDNSHIWGEQYNRKLSDILVVQEAISREVSEKLRVQLTGEEKKRLRKAGTENPEAYQLYLKGRYYWNKRTVEGIKKAIEYFNQAIEKDPSYALAYSGLADSYMYLLGSLHGLSLRETYLRAKSSATKALEIDDNLAEAHTSLAMVKFGYEWDWAASEREFKRALELNPNEAEAHHQYSHYLTAVGRTHESLVESLRALELEPLSLPLNAHLAWHYLYARQYDQAIEQCRRTIEMDPNYPPAHEFLAGAYEQKGMHQEAIAEFQKAISIRGDGVQNRAGLGHAYAVAGKEQEALKIIDELKGLSKETYIRPYDVAVIYVGLDQNDQAFDWLQKASEERSGWLRYLKVDPRLDPIRSDPRFPDLIRRVGLTP